MAVKSIKEKVVLRLKTREETENSGEKFSTKSYTGVKKLASDENIYRVGEIISSLQARPLEEISKQETTILIKE